MFAERIFKAEETNFKVESDFSGGGLNNSVSKPPTFDLTSQIQITPLTEYSSPSDAFGDDDERPF